MARAFGVFDHWFCEVPSQTFMNRSFWTAATSSGLVVNSPATKWLTQNDAETIFNRLEEHGKTWKVYVGEPMQFSATAIIHFPRLKDRLATHFVPFAQFEADAAAGDLPDFSFIEPCLTRRAQRLPPRRRAILRRTAWRSPASTRRRRSWAVRRSCPGSTNAYKAMQSPTGSNVWNTTLLIGWDEPGGTYDHVPPPPVPPPDPAAPVGESGFTFDRSGYRVPAIIVSPWVAEGDVFNQEHRHTSLIATLREQWDLGEPFTARDAAARTFSHAFTLDTPRDPNTWPDPTPRPVPQFTVDALALGQVVSVLGKTLLDGIRGYAAQNNIEIDGHAHRPQRRDTPGARVERDAELPGHVLPAPGPEQVWISRRSRVERLLITR